MVEKKRFLIYANIEELEKIKKASKIEDRSINNFIVRNALIASEIVIDSEKEEVN